MAQSLNTVQLIGNLGQDPTIIQFDNGGASANFSLATSESYTPKGSDEKVTKTEWHKIVAYGKAAEIMEKYLSKGDKVYIQGNLTTRKWTDKEGIERYTTEVKVRDFLFLTPKEQSAPAPPSDSSDDLPFDY